MENQKKSSKKVVWAVVGLVIVAAILAGVYFLFAPKGSAGEKTITVEVVDAWTAATPRPPSPPMLSFCAAPWSRKT